MANSAPSGLRRTLRGGAPGDGAEGLEDGNPGRLEEGRLEEFSDGHSGDLTDISAN